jgi:hypothetical protein
MFNGIDVLDAYDHAIMEDAERYLLANAIISHRVPGLPMSNLRGKQAWVLAQASTPAWRTPAERETWLRQRI